MYVICKRVNKGGFLKNCKLFLSLWLTISCWPPAAKKDLPSKAVIVRKDPSVSYVPKNGLAFLFAKSWLHPLIQDMR